MSATMVPPQSQKKEKQLGDRPTKSVKWSPVSADDRYDIQLAEGSIRPMSEAALRTMALELKKVGAIDVLHLLQWLNVPDADEIAAAVENEMRLAALAKITRK